MEYRVQHRVEYRAKYRRVEAGSGNRRGIGETAPIPETRSGRPGRGIGRPRNFIDKLPTDLAITGSDKIPAITDPGKAVIIFVTNNRLVVVVIFFLICKPAPGQALLLQTHNPRVY